MVKHTWVLTLLALFCVVAIKCKKDDTEKAPPAPTQMKIVGISLDSAFQISNPMSFVVKVQSSSTVFQTTPYNLPFSNQPWYPSGTWQGLNETFDVSSQITMSVYFQLPGSSQLYPEGDYSVFNFRPDNMMGATKNTSPTTLSFTNTSPGAVPTKITLSVIWN
jgi:hypothetical protein